MLYMNVLLGATVRDNLSEKRGGGYTGVLSSVSATFQHRYAALPAPHHPHTACDYLHPFEIIKTRESQIIVTDS